MSKANVSGIYKKEKKLLEYLKTGKKFFLLFLKLFLTSPVFCQLQSWVMNTCQIWVAAFSDPLLVLHVSQLDCFMLRGRWRRLIVTSNCQLIDNHSCNCPKERSDNWNPPPVWWLTIPGKQKERAQGKDCSLSVIFALGSGAMQDLTLPSHHHPLAQDNSTCTSAELPRQTLPHTHKHTQTL